MKPRRHHSDNRQKAAADRDLLAEHSIVAPEALLPNLMTQDRDEIPARTVLLVREPAPDERSDAEGREKTCGHELGVHFNGVARAGDVLTQVPNRRHFFKGAARLLPV